MTTIMEKEPKQEQHEQQELTKITTSTMMITMMKTPTTTVIIIIQPRLPRTAAESLQKYLRSPPLGSLAQIEPMLSQVAKIDLW